MFTCTWNNANRLKQWLNNAEKELTDPDHEEELQLQKKLKDLCDNSSFEIEQWLYHSNVGQNRDGQSGGIEESAVHSRSFYGCFFSRSNFPGVDLPNCIWF